MPRLTRLLGAALLTLACTGAAADEMLDRIVAVVNDSVVLQSEFEDEMRGVREQISRNNMRAPPRSELRRQVLERLVLQRLQLDAASDAGIDVDEATLDAAVRRVADNNNLGLSEFRDALLAEGMTMSSYRERLRREITLGRLRQEEMRQRVDVTPREIEEFLDQQGDSETEYRLAHILISVPEAARPAAVQEAGTTAEQVRRELGDGEDFASVAAARSDSRTALDGGDLGWRERGEVPSVLSDDIDDLEPGEVSRILRSPSGFHIFRLSDRRTGEREMVTETRARHILIETNDVVTDRDAETRLENLRQRIESGDSFEELARANSDDAGTASRGGDLGWVTLGTMVPAFEEEMSRTEPGEISAPFESQFGWHIVEVLDRRERDATDEYLRSRAARQIQQRKEEEEVQLWLRQLRDEAYVDYRLNV